MPLSSTSLAALERAKGAPTAAVAKWQFEVLLCAERAALEASLGSTRLLAMSCMRPASSLCTPLLGLTPIVRPSWPVGHSGCSLPLPSLCAARCDEVRSPGVHEKLCDVACGAAVRIVGRTAVSIRRSQWRSTRWVRVSDARGGVEPGCVAKRCVEVQAAGGLVGSIPHGRQRRLAQPTTDWGQLAVPSRHYSMRGTQPHQYGCER